MIPSPYTLQVKRRIEGDLDDFNNPTISYADPVDWPVRGYSPGANELVSTSNRDLSAVLWTVYADVTDDLPAVLDLVTLDGKDYLVESEPADWTHGPFPNPVAGATVFLKDTEG